MEALVIGTRKSGTTWLYSNLLEDGRFSLSRKVKESGFFSGNFSGSRKDYLALYDEQNDGCMLEVDTSICYSDIAPQLISKYAPQVKLILILRDPVEYLVSRYTHSLRKGEIEDKDVQLAVKNNKWLENELDYPKIISRFQDFNTNGKLLVLSYESLQSDSNKFYKKITKFILGESAENIEPNIVDRVNIARNSRMPYISKTLSDLAKLARKKGLHHLVNLAKSFKLHSLIEKNVEDKGKELLRKSARKVISTEFSESLKIWRAVHGEKI